MNGRDQPNTPLKRWIVVTALIHDLTVVTRNVADFAGTGVALLNPWEVSGPTAGL